MCRSCAGGTAREPVRDPCHSTGNLAAGQYRVATSARGVPMTARIPAFWAGLIHSRGGIHPGQSRV